MPWQSYNRERGSYAGFGIAVLLWSYALDHKVFRLIEIFKYYYLAM